MCRAEFETHRELIEAIASAQFAQTPMETTLVRIFAKQCRPRSADVETPIKTPIPNPHSVNKQDDPDHHPTFAVRTRHLPPIRLDSKKRLNNHQLRARHFKARCCTSVTAFATSCAYTLLRGLALGSGTVTQRRMTWGLRQ